jgi:hypothetical protein
MLNAFFRWAEETISLLPSNVRADLTVGPESENRSARLDFDAPARAGRVTCWDSGDFNAEIIDIESGHELFDQHGEFQSAVAMKNLLRPFLDKLGIPSN